MIRNVHVHVNRLHRFFLNQPLRNGRKSRDQLCEPPVECLVAGQFGKPIQQVHLGVGINRLDFKSPLYDPPQENRSHLFVCKLGTEIVAQALHLL